MNQAYFSLKNAALCHCVFALSIFKLCNYIRAKFQIQLKKDHIKFNSDFYFHLD
jgi:hypothetical protein